MSHALNFFLSLNHALQKKHKQTIYLLYKANLKTWSCSAIHERWILVVLRVHNYSAYVMVMFLWWPCMINIRYFSDNCILFNLLLCITCFKAIKYIFVPSSATTLCRDNKIWLPKKKLFIFILSYSMSFCLFFFYFVQTIFDIYVQVFQ